MLNYYSEIIIKSFFVTPWIMIPVLLLGVISVVVMCLFCILLLLDTSYRPNTEQYPFNFILDRCLPLMVIFLPTIIFSVINLENGSWMQRIGYIILTHICFLIPLMYFWSKHRNWDVVVSESKISRQWSNPKLYLDLSIALIYPALWGFYFSLLRYLRLGSYINIGQLKIFSYSSEEGILLLFFVSGIINVVIWALILISTFIVIKNYIWHSFAKIIYSLHLEFLRYSLYSNFLEKIHKLHFIYFNLVSLNAPLNNNNPQGTYSKFRQIINNLYYYPIIWYITLLVIIVSEIIITKKILYSYYLIFAFTIAATLLNCFSAATRTFFIKDVCMVDYLRQDLSKIRYKRVFWMMSEDPEMFYGFSIEIPVEKYQIWQQEYNKNHEKNMMYSHKVIERLFHRINQQNKLNNNITFAKKIMVAYYKVNKVHWTRRKNK